MDENVIKDPVRTIIYASGPERPIQSMLNILTALISLNYRQLDFLLERLTVIQMYPVNILFV
jgi:hypothetical protein